MLAFAAMGLAAGAQTLNVQSAAQQMKRGYLNKAKDFVGRLVNVDIGIPAPEGCLRLAEDGDFRELLGPRKHFSNKGDYGYVALLGGCRSYSGAAKLSSLSLAALRSGCGVSLLAVPRSSPSSTPPPAVSISVAFPK